MGGPGAPNERDMGKVQIVFSKKKVFDAFLIENGFIVFFYNFIGNFSNIHLTGSRC